MIVKQIYSTENQSQILINIPESFKGRKYILVVLDDSVDSRSAKLELMKKASNDPLFLSDIEEITSDFKNVDSELQ
jgi:hypothetical protein